MSNQEIDRAALREARASLAGAMRARRRATREAAGSAAALERLLRAHGSGDERVRRAGAEHEGRLRGLEEARAAAAGGGKELVARLGEWLGRDAEADVARLRTDFPVVLFPVRVETRFALARGGEELRVRIYPDAIQAEAHDPPLTDEELAAGRRYWESAWTGEEAEAWRELLVQVDAPRAAWIVRATEPLNLAERPEGELLFPEVELRAESWDRAPTASLLPDRWIVLAYREGVEVRRAVSRPVQEPLALGFDPQSPPGTGIDVSGDGLELDEELLWTVDFPRAVEAGMALRIPLDAQDARRGFDRVLVLGVKGSLSPEEGGAALEELLDAHHYGEGLALVAQGTPTNNTDTARTPFPPPDPDGARSFAVERGSAFDTEDGDGRRLMRALGLSAGVVAHVEGAARTEQAAAQAMNEALWPVTWGYFLEQMMAPHVGEAAVAETRRYFVEHVRGRGPLPALRVGGQPYGVLPVASLDYWAPRRGAAAADVQLPPLLRRLRDVWRAQVGQVPRVGRTQDPDADLLAVLGMDASTREVRVREVHGPDFRLNLLALFGLDATAWQQAQLLIAFPVMNLIGFPTLRPRILGMDFADGAGRFRHPLVAPAPLSEEAGLESALGFDYVRWIREATVDELRDETLPEGREPPDTLLYRMLRHARLEELRRVAVALQVAHGLADTAERREPELMGIAEATLERPTIWQRLERPIPALTGDAALGAFLVGDGQAPETRTLRDYDAALAALEGLPTAELERLFTETLDLCSHRLDAWINSLAAKRLDEIRGANPTGVHLGAFGWVEGLFPAAAGGSREVTLEDGRTARVATANAGYVHAPSMQHATTAAVLRNGHLTRSGEQGEAYAVDLSSARVRTALSVLDAVRQGEQIGAVLGYRFERGLHDRRVDWFIEPLRRRFPLLANRTGDPELEGPPDTVAARSVVDGLALRNAWKEGALDLAHPDFARAGEPSTPAERAAVEAELQLLEDATDATADLLTAEAVFQIVGGNTAGANASLDALARGGRPPEPAVAHAPRSGIPLTHRVGILLGGNPPQAAGWDAEPTPRARAEPHVDGWAGGVLGDPASVLCRVTVRLPGEAPDAPPELSEETLSLAALRLRPLDLLALARAASEGAVPLSELDQRVAEAALAGAPPGARVEGIVYARAESWRPDEVRTFPEVLEVASALNRLLASARPLTRADLVPAGAAPLLPATDPLAGEALDRAAAAREAFRLAGERLTAVLGAADAAGLRRELRGVSRFGIPDTFPRSDDLSVLSERATAALAEVERRLAGAAAAPDAAAAARAVFGRDFPFLLRFTPPHPEELGQALAAGPALVGDARAAKSWIYQAARVRPALAEWRKLALLCGALGTHPGTLDVVQLPFRASARWVALPFGEGAKPPSGTLSLTLHRLAAPGSDQPWAGLLLDEWDETIPEREAPTGVAFHFDTPGAEPPQAVLVAVPPTDAEAWDLAGLAATLHEALDLAKLRAVDGELLGALGQLLPAIYLAANAANDTVSTGFGGALIPDRPVVLSAET